MNSKNKICEFFLGPSDLKQQGGKVREIFICGMKLWQEMRIRKSFLLGCELVPIWATSKVEKMGVTPGQGPRFAFPWVRLSIFPGRRMSLSSASFMMFLATSNSKSTPAGLNHKENAASHMIRGGVTSGSAKQQLNVISKNLCSVHLSTSSVGTRWLPQLQTPRTHTRPRERTLSRSHPPTLS